MKNYVNLSEEELSVVEGGASAKCILGTAATFYLASGLNPAALIATGIIAAASFC
ncbi:ComC/BlpC family peptide pheromone/bacteriocin [Streptococcus suis]|nr:ComC/BlpC family peptide pheromone/bacteriocin [Streptococcus suis]NQI73651.1 ComC/BlpC family peptide pheromone/bacteriocin [Streptococcus suis]